MALKALALKEEGTHPSAEGVVARVAQIRGIRSLSDIEKLRDERPDIVLVDLDMPHLNAEAVLQSMRGTSRHEPIYICFHFQTQPAELLRRLASLTAMRARRPQRSRSLAYVVRLLGVSQEVLARILGVSARTVHRWLGGSRPRRSPELERLLEMVAFLEQALPNAAGIRSYLHHANPNLGGARPIELLIRGEYDRVAADLQAIQEGVYV